jgi:hypothetical protein
VAIDGDHLSHPVTRLEPTRRRGSGHLRPPLIRRRLSVPRLQRVRARLFRLPALLVVPTSATASARFALPGAPGSAPSQWQAIVDLPDDHYTPALTASWVASRVQLTARGQLSRRGSVGFRSCAAISPRAKFKRSGRGGHRCSCRTAVPTAAMNNARFAVQSSATSESIFDARLTPNSCTAASVAGLAQRRVL